WHIEHTIYFGPFAKPLAKPLEKVRSCRSPATIMYPRETAVRDAAQIFTGKEEGGENNEAYQVYYKRDLNQAEHDFNCDAAVLVHGAEMDGLAQNEKFDYKARMQLLNRQVHKMRAATG
ncbi:9140_t:CDS:2, partial [Acaulospora colombiana]